jgi:hypothetical protein
MPERFALSIDPFKHKATLLGDLFWGTFHH